MQIGVCQSLALPLQVLGCWLFFVLKNQIFKHQQTAASKSVGAQMAITNPLMLFLNVLTTESLKGMESDMK